MSVFWQGGVKGGVGGLSCYPGVHITQWTIYSQHLSPAHTRKGWLWFTRAQHGRRNWQKYVMRQLTSQGLKFRPWANSDTKLWTKLISVFSPRSLTDTFCPITLMLTNARENISQSATTSWSLALWVTTPSRKTKYANEHSSSVLTIRTRAGNWILNFRVRPD